MIEIWYDPGLSIVQVVTYTSAQNWVQRGSDIPVSFSNGDRFGAQATANGLVKVYKNSTLLATVDVAAWPYYASGGYVGLWTIGASGSLLDDFGGGTMGSSTPTDTPTPTLTPSLTPTPSQTLTPSASPTATLTPTNTQTPAATATFTPTPTASDTPTPTATSSSAFPVAGVLDNFNRANGGISSSWSGSTGAYSINNQKVSVSSDGDIYWNATSFGANQEAYVTLSNINSNSDEIDLLFKSQSSSGWTGGLIEVWYDPGLSIVQVVTYTSSQDWVQRGSDIPVSFSNGDRIGAQATASGQVKVYKNSTLLATVDVTAWPYYTNGGYIGLWTIEASGSLLDDFGGGTIPQGRAPGWNLASLLDGVKVLLRAPVEWVGQLFGMPKLAALVPVKIHAEELQTETHPPVGQIWKNYIVAGGQRVAVREYTSTNLTGTVYFLLGDHLGSTSVVVNAATGVGMSQIRYREAACKASAYGGERIISGMHKTRRRS